jgi:4-hydroxybutyryl-CoA dehydratase/vinylacetyl-CoA-Delta-isomerase
LKTAEQYEESLRKMNFKVYLLGELIKNPVDNPIIRPSMNSVKMTYALAQDPQHEDLMTAKSHLTGEKINRFCHLHQSTEDLIKKVKMQRLLGQKTASCFQRCVGMDAINAVDSVTFEMDEKLGTKYHERFIKFLKMIQEQDLTVDGAMTDPKGDRSLPPGKQGWYCRAGRQSTSDRSHQFALDFGDADDRHVQRRCRLCPFFCRPCRRGRRILYLWPAVL